MQKIRQFIFTVFIGGLIVILPIAILLKVLSWLLDWMTELIQPLTGLISETTHANTFVSQGMGILSMIVGCFLVGLFVKTAWGKWLHHVTEHWFFARIPGYKTLRDLFAQLQSNKKNGFSKPVMISFDGNDNYFLGFVTDQYDDNRFAVFIPTSPSPIGSTP